MTEATPTSKTSFLFLMEEGKFLNICMSLTTHLRRSKPLRHSLRGLEERVLRLLLLTNRLELTGDWRNIV
jgi:hypothetical protein